MSLQNFEEYAALIGPFIKEALQAAVREIPAPCQPAAKHILGAGGKRLRPMLTVLCARMLGNASESVFKLGASMELLHAATLLHDDVLDNAASRRGQKAAHLVFGNAQAILTGDAMLACGNAIVASFNQPGLTACYSKATMQTAAGEIMEMNALRQPDLNETEYLEIARGKTACLIAQSCALGAISANANGRQTDLCFQFGENLGIAFQLIDDALDFAPEAQTGKPGGGDLREGKMTPPLQLYRKHLSDQAKIAFDESFKNSGFDAQTLEKMICAIKEFAAQARELAKPFLQRARNCLEQLPSGKENAILAQMVDYVGERSK